MMSLYAASRACNVLMRAKKFSILSRPSLFSKHVIARSPITTSNARLARISRNIASVCLVPTTTVYLYKRFNATPTLCEYKSVKTRVYSVDETDSVEWTPGFPYLEFLKILLPDLGLLILAICAALAAAYINIQIPITIGNMGNVLSGSSPIDMNDLVEQAKCLFQYSVIQGLLTAAYISMLSAIGERVAARLRCKLFESIIHQDIEFFDSHKTGELISRLTSDVQDFKSSFKLTISQGLRCFTQVIGSTYTLFTISPYLSGILSVALPLMIGAGSLIGGYLRQLSCSSQAQVAKAMSVADEAIGNVRTVRAFAMEDTEVSLYKHEIEKSATESQMLGFGIGLFQGLSNMAINGIVLVSFFVGGQLIVQNSLKPGDLISFIIASQSIQKSMAQMSVVFGQVVRGMSAGQRVFQYMHKSHKINSEGGEIIPFHSLVGDIHFKNVNFSYPTRREQVILEDFNLKVPGGTMVALVGLSGNGKSTVAALLDRFYDIDSGSISIDGRDIRDLDPKWLRGRAIAFISQEPVLFATSIMENIRYGKPSATDAEVIAAAKLANADDFITSFPSGYSTVLGERGVTVSGGQKQRIAIARALIKKPSIMILDEATSALDTESEQLVQETMNKIMKNYTVIVIAHRLSTVKEANNIVVMSKGKIVESGTHNELRNKKGAYWNLIKRQEFKSDGDK